MAKKSLIQEYREVQKKAREEFKKLPPDEQKKRLEGQRRLLRRMENEWSEL